MRLHILIASALIAATGCTSTPSQFTTAPVTRASCKLSAEELAGRRYELIPGLFDRAEKVEDVRNGLRFRFAGKPGVLRDLVRVMEQEQDCCSFLAFELTMEPNEGPVTFEVTGPEGTGTMLRSL